LNTDKAKWQQDIVDLTKLEFANKAEEIAAECRMDLIEALAEYNIASALITGEIYRVDLDIFSIEARGRLRLIGQSREERIEKSFKKLELRSAHRREL